MINKLTQVKDRFRRRHSNIYKRPIRGIITYDIQPDAFIGVCWKEVREFGASVSISLYIHNQEVLRFDCGGERGHYHVRQQSEKKEAAYDDRIYFEETDPEQQIERSIQIIFQKAQTLLEQYPDPKINRFRLVRHSLTQALEPARIKMMEYLRAYL